MDTKMFFNDKRLKSHLSLGFLFKYCIFGLTLLLIILWQTFLFFSRNISIFEFSPVRYGTGLVTQDLIWTCLLRNVKIIPTNYGQLLRTFTLRLPYRKTLELEMRYIRNQFKVRLEKQKSNRQSRSILEVEHRLCDIQVSKIIIGVLNSSLSLV